MVVSVRVVKGRKAIDEVRQISTRFPDAIGEASREFGKSLQFRLKRELTVRRLNWTWTLHRSIRWNQTGKMSGNLSMKKYGVFLDAMRPHFVKLKRGRRIRQWASDHGIDKPFLDNEWSIKVRPHPWISAPLERTVNNLDRILERHADAVVKSNGRRLR